MNVHAITNPPQPINDVCRNTRNCNATNYVGGRHQATFTPHYLDIRSSLLLAYELGINESSGKDPPVSYYKSVGRATFNNCHTQLLGKIKETSQDCCGVDPSLGQRSGSSYRYGHEFQERVGGVACIPQQVGGRCLNDADKSDKDACSIQLGTTTNASNDEYETITRSYHLDSRSHCSRENFKKIPALMEDPTSPSHCNIQDNTFRLVNTPVTTASH